ncbi:hypothetical protein BLNAU_11850 [Blattamonas nauphoetae]|uniref:Uncharacterized protein n=1 Tax=Blattamonas nauphoetae TaxID=2049346 RepID=A0ABQ9XNA1_9EUKA|nr:hypothetical protein BLNAU_11850 [Blattamonas nauphoetae]
MNAPTSTKPFSIESVLDELTRSGSNVSVIENTRFWNQIPLLIRDWDGKDETTLMKLLDELSRMITLASDSEVSVANKRLLHSSLSTISQNPTFTTKGCLRINNFLATLDSLPDGPFMLEETEEFHSIEQSLTKSETRLSNTIKHKMELESQINDLQHDLEKEKQKTGNSEIYQHETEIESRSHDLNQDYEKHEQVGEEKGETERKKMKEGMEKEEVDRWKMREGNSPTIEEIQESLATTEERITTLERELASERKKKRILKERMKMMEEKGGQCEGENGDLENEGQLQEGDLHRKNEEKRRIERERDERRRWREEKERAEDERRKRMKLERELRKSEREIIRLNDERRKGFVEQERKKNEVRSRQLAILPIWVGTESLKTIDRTAHKLTPTTIDHIIIHPKNNPFRTAFTLPIAEGEWELKIRVIDYEPNLMLGFIRHPLPDNATQKSCGTFHGGIGGEFVLWNGQMWKGNEIKPAGTNKKCKLVGQTAAIRVNMWTKEARLFVDDEEQPGIFTNIPSPLCLGITTGFQIESQSVEVMWLKRLRGHDELQGSENAIRVLVEEMRVLKLENDELNHQLADLPIWIGTKSLQTLDRIAHKLTPTTLTQIIATPEEEPLRTAFTHPIDEGEWELKIRVNQSTFIRVGLGFLRHPLPEKATFNACGNYYSGIGGNFILSNGRMWHSAKEFKPAGTNKKCDRVGQTAAIRVNMWKREARLLVDEEEQPGIFTDIPSPLCLGITTHQQDTSIEVLWLKQRRGNDDVEQSALEGRQTLKLEHDKLKLQLAGLPIWIGTKSLQTLDTSTHKLTPTTLTQIHATTPDDPWRTAFTFPIDEGEWELQIRANDSTFSDVLLGFLLYPLSIDDTHGSCGDYNDESGGAFLLYNGRMWRSGKEYKPAGTNRWSGYDGQTTAIRVNMSTREARLFVDDEQQPGIFTDIPSPLCLAITTGFDEDDQSVDVMWLKRLRGNDDVEQSALEARRTLKLDNDQMKQQLKGLPIWIGTESLRTHNRNVHTLSPTTLTQIIVTPSSNPWRTAFTFPIDEGEWELKIRASENTFMQVSLGFLRLPLPEKAVLTCCGSYGEACGGDFDLWNGGMWHEVEVESAAKNKKCDRLGQTAAIRVNMRTRQARLLIDDVEQPGVFLQHPLPENATLKSCRAYHSGIGSDFTLWNGGMWKRGKEFKPESTNKKFTRVGQTAAIRVNMSTREARLFVDDEEQPGIFTSIPSLRNFGEKQNEFLRRDSRCRNKPDIDLHLGKLGTH